MEAGGGPDGHSPKSSDFAPGQCLSCGQACHIDFRRTKYPAASNGTKPALLTKSALLIGCGNKGRENIEIKGAKSYYEEI